MADTKKMSLIPFQVNKVVENVTEIPPGVKLVGAPDVWNVSEKGDGVVVAVLDTGCDTKHPDLQDRIIGGRNFTNEGGREDFSDGQGHGTHVAGTIAATENDRGVLGVAPKAKLLILKVLDSSGSGTYEGIVDAINYAVQWRGPNNEKVRVISMSLGGSVDTPELHQAVVNAVNQQILVVAAAGNDGKEKYIYPGGYNEVVEVGAVDLNKTFSQFSNQNLEVDLVAPGEKILSTYLNGQYAYLTGTSMATPHVSGAAALVIKQCEREFQRTLTEAEIYAQIIKRTVALGNPKKQEGNGILDLTVGWQVPTGTSTAAQQTKAPVMS